MRAPVVVIPLGYPDPEAGIRSYGPFTSWSRLMGRQYGFVDACAGKSIDDLPAGVPMLFVRAGEDQCPGLNDALDNVIVSGLARNLPLTLVNHATGAHGFESDEDSAISRGIIQQVLAFLRWQLHSLG